MLNNNQIERVNKWWNENEVEKFHPVDVRGIDERFTYDGCEILLDGNPGNVVDCDVYTKSGYHFIVQVSVPVLNYLVINRS